MRKHPSWGRFYNFSEMFGNAKLKNANIAFLVTRCDSTRLVPRFQKGSRSWVRWVQGLGPWWILDLARPFCRGTLETQDLKIVLCRKTLETQDLKILICSDTLKTQNLKILIVARPWKPRTLKFGYVAKPWKHRTQNLKLLMSRGLKGQSQLLKGRPIYSNDCGKYSLCQLDHAQ